MSLTFDEVAGALLSSSWIFAKTMPEVPHWYTLRKQWEQAADFEGVVQFIRDHGYREKYGRSWYTRMDLNGLKYWSMGAPLSATILINRAVIDALHPYDYAAPSYDAMWSSPEARAEDAAVISAIDYQRGSVLDIGCGSGLFLDHVEPDEYLGIDPSRGMLEKLEDKHPEASTLCSSFEGYYPAGRRFDLVIGLFAAPSYIQPEALARIPQLVAPGGKFFLMFYAPGYEPETHKVTGDLEFFTYREGCHPGNSSRLGNFTVVEG